MPVCILLFQFTAVHVKNGDIVEEGAKLFDVELFTPSGIIVEDTKICRHPGLYNGICISCGKVPDNVMQELHEEHAPNRSSSSSSHCIYRSLTVGGGHTIRLSKEESEKVSAIRTNTLKSQTKIALVLDIDHTMLHACMSPTEAKPHGYEHCDLKYLPLTSPYGQISHHWLRLRPNLSNFLEQANKKCLLYVYTHGTRGYAEGVAKILDPTEKYFANRIFSKTDVPELGSDKKLERICLGEADMALIMDDNENVWRGPQQRQLLLVKPYQFFKKMEDINNAPGNEYKNDYLIDHNISILLQCIRISTYVSICKFTLQELPPRGVSKVVSLMLMNMML